MNNIKCEICGNNKIIKLTQVAEINVLICKICSFSFLETLPSEEYIEKFYKTNYRKENTGEEINSIVLNTEKSRGGRVINFIKNNCDLNKIKTILDIGCSTGTLLDLIKNETNNSKLDGIELNEIFCRYINENKKHINVISQKIENFSNENINKYDLITIVHVLEHLPNPTDKLSNIHSLLKDNGLLYVEVPNLLTPYNHLWKQYFQLYHISYFTSINLAYLLEKEGFSIINSYNPVGTSIGFICKKEIAAKISDFGITANYKFLYIKLYLYILKYNIIQSLIFFGARKIYHKIKQWKKN